MGTVDREVPSNSALSRRAALTDFIASRKTKLDFKLSDWLQTLDIVELQRIEEDAKACCQDDIKNSLSEIELVDLVDAALMAYLAEMSFEVSHEDALDCLDDLLTGFGVAACIERLKRIGWVVVTSRIGILVEDARPYRVTFKGLNEGFWSSEPMTLWILGASLQIN